MSERCELYWQITNRFQEAVSVLCPDAAIKVFGLPVLSVIEGQVSGRIYRVFVTAKKQFDRRLVELAMAKTMASEGIEVFIEAGGNDNYTKCLIIREERYDGIWYHQISCREPVKLINGYYASLSANGMEGTVQEDQGRLLIYHSRKNYQELIPFSWSDLVNPKLGKRLKVNAAMKRR